MTARMVSPSGWNITANRSPPSPWSARWICGTRTGPSRYRKKSVNSARTASSAFRPTLPAAAATAADALVRAPRREGEDRGPGEGDEERAQHHERGADDEGVAGELDPALDRRALAHHHGR